MVVIWSIMKMWTGLHHNWVLCGNIVLIKKVKREAEAAFYQIVLLIEECSSFANN